MKKLLILLFFPVLVFGQGKAEFTVQLRDGNVVTGTSPKFNKVSLSTDYGKLEIPIKNVSSITFGIPTEESKRDQIKNWAAQLSNSNEELRKKAYESIMAIGPGAISILEDVFYSPDYQPAEFSDYSLSNLINDIKSTYNLQNTYQEDDVVRIDYMYEMGGKFDFKSLELKTEYGTLNIPRIKIEKIDVNYFDPSDANAKTFKLMANTHISGNANNGWLNTGIKVKTGQKINIKATGEITLASLSNGKYNPDGKVGAATYDDYDYGDGGNYPKYGNVVYRIGETGTVTKAGSNYNGTATQSGVLYLSIYETVYNQNNSGFYIVNVSVK